MNNGRRHTQIIKLQARALRVQGLTHREIAEKLGMSASSACAWTYDLPLTLQQEIAMRERRYKSTFTPERRKKLSEHAKLHLPKYITKYTPEDLIKKIKAFFTFHGRIPLKREFNMYNEYKRHFGSWNNAIAVAGFEPHQVIFSKKFTAKDNHICDSFAERIIDDWLTKHSISHVRNMPYQGTKLTADFAIGNIRIEYFGLQGVVSGYDKTIERKKELCAQEGLVLLEIYPPDLFSKKFKKCLGRILWTVRKNL